MRLTEVTATEQVDLAIDELRAIKHKERTTKNLLRK